MTLTHVVLARYHMVRHWHASSAEWDVNDVVSWISKIAPACILYAPLFNDFGVSGSVLQSITSAQLQEMGIDKGIVRDVILDRVQRLKPLSDDDHKGSVSPTRYTCIRLEDLKFVRPIAEGNFGQVTPSRTMKCQFAPCCPEAVISLHVTLCLGVAGSLPLKRRCGKEVEKFR